MYTIRFLLNLTTELVGAAVIYSLNYYYSTVMDGLERKTLSLKADVSQQSMVLLLKTNGVKKYKLRW